MSGVHILLDLANSMPVSGLHHHYKYGVNKDDSVFKILNIPSVTNLVKYESTQVG